MCFHDAQKRPQDFPQGCLPLPQVISIQVPQVQIILTARCSENEPNLMGTQCSMESGKVGRKGKGAWRSWAYSSSIRWNHLGCRLIPGAPCSASRKPGSHSANSSAFPKTFPSRADWGSGQGEEAFLNLICDLE